MLGFVLAPFVYASMLLSYWFYLQIFAAMRNFGDHVMSPVDCLCRGQSSRNSLNCTRLGIFVVLILQFPLNEFNRIAVVQGALLGRKLYVVLRVICRNSTIVHDNFSFSSPATEQKETSRNSSRWWGAMTDLL